ncbi:homeobox-leucine zipper protein HOX11-like [Diospyros lotus]|uniref:homeobox-leucine zipper protein HOX11-like n=1 Tax=Diospyros lotus TaxID=55363 RepID=UPI002251FCC9|nr:homeobox-leucine zipper protein HOX11-like [Diospyros lotus]
MELGLSLGESSRPPFGFLAKDRGVRATGNGGLGLALGFSSNGKQPESGQASGVRDDGDKSEEATKRGSRNGDHHHHPLQLDLLPLAPVSRHSSSHQPGLSWPSDNGSSEGGSSGMRGLDVNRLPPPPPQDPEDGAAVSSPNSVASSFRMDFCMYRGAGGSAGAGSKRDSEAAGNDSTEGERVGCRNSDDDDNGLTRKKLRLSKEQSAYLEESFKEHSTLNPKQKIALAKQLNLRPRQVEVWFQNRRARTKLKQTEVDCEYLKRCCETLTEENRRLHKELQELRALKTSTPFYMQLPATTLTMCPSCERVATTTTTTTTSATAAANSGDPSPKAAGPFPLSRPRFYPFSQPHQSAAS